MGTGVGALVGGAVCTLAGAGAGAAAVTGGTTRTGGACTGATRTGAGGGGGAAAPPQPPVLPRARSTRRPPPGFSVASIRWYACWLVSPVLISRARAAETWGVAIEVPVSQAYCPPV